MASLAAQLDDARVSSRAAFSVELANRALIEKMFDMWDRGEISSRQIRFRLEAVIRASYRASGGLGRELAARSSDIPGWRPTDLTWKTPYLDNLQADARAAVTEYIRARGKKSNSPEQIAKARKRAIMRAQHSAGVATTRGYTDGIVGAYEELESLGFRVQKVWVANFVNNEPCPRCKKLHGQRIRIQERFKDLDGEGIYRDLMGPPRHPRCKCFLLPLIINLGNILGRLDLNKPEGEERKSMTAQEVRDLPETIYNLIIESINAVSNWSPIISQGVQAVT